MTVTGQSTAYYTYDVSGRLIKISTKIGTKTKDFNITYDKAGKRTSLNIPLRGKGKNIPTLTTNYSYDIASRPLNMKYLKSTTVLEDLLYEYDPNENRTKFKRNATQPLRDGVTDADYNEANQNQMITFVPSVGATKNMTYDANGNLTSVTNSCGTYHLYLGCEE